MRYAIMTNPVSGKMSADQKRSALRKAAHILNAEICGLDTGTPDEFSRCVRETEGNCDVIVAAGGDGTLSDVINSINLKRTAVAYLPLGSGNSIQHALNYKGNLADIAVRIREGKIREYDLIDCDKKRQAIMVGIGFDGTILRLRDQYLAQGSTGFKVYFRAVLKAYFKEFKRPTVKLTIDDSAFMVENLLTLLIAKQPYYGYGMKVVRRARFDDGQLHVQCINSRLFKCAIGALTSFAYGNSVGRYHTGKKLRVNLERPLLLNIDGNKAWESDAFTFTALPKALRIKC